MPDISVIVPVFKVEEYLAECVDSILKQRFTDFELILVDDGSPDRCGLICDNYAKRDNRIKVIHQENGGLSCARNAGIDIATGTFITFIDSDDIVSPYYLEELRQAIDQYNAEIAVCDTICYTKDVFSDNNSQHHKNVCLGKREAVVLLYSNKAERLSVSAWGKIYRKRLFEKIRFPVGKIHEDQRVIPIVIYRAENVAWVREGLYAYRRRAGSITQGTFSVKRYDDIEAVNKCIDYFESRHESKIAEAARKRKDELTAYYSLLARKEGIYRQLPKSYKMCVCQAIYRLRRDLPYDVFTYRVAQIYPIYVSVDASLRRILQLVTVYNTGNKPGFFRDDFE